jgi:Sulfotransferase family
LLPNFLVIGGTKCGTTSLFRYLSRHPSIYVAPKELRYFTEEHNHRRGADWYRAQFAAAQGYAAVGESSNAYTRDPVYRGVPERIHALLPEARLLYLVRDPLRRIESHYRHRLVTGAEWRDPEAAVRNDAAYVAASRYGHQLRLYLSRFDREQILVVQSEKLFANPEVWLPRICEHIGVTHRPHFDLTAENVSAEREVVPPLLRPLARLPRARPLLKRTPRLVEWLRRGDRKHTANQPEFVLSPALHTQLVETLRADRRLLIDLAGEDVADWRVSVAPTPPAAQDEPVASA